MAKSTRGRRRMASRQYRSSPYPLPSASNSKGVHAKNCSKIKKDWEDATCSVCMECPHNAVLLLCSSHDKGCRPYMCGTSSRYSNCLDQYKKAYTKVTSSFLSQTHQASVDGLVPLGPLSSWGFEKSELAELACPLCRGQVKGWTVVEPARDYLNTKKRSCMQEKCSFVGTYKELRKHVKTEHPFARPHAVDPLVEQKWRRLEHEREREDVISTIRSSMPGAVVFGDYVIEGSHYGFEDEDGLEIDPMERNEGFELGNNGAESNLMNVFVFLERLNAYGTAGSNRGTRMNNRDSNQSPDGVAGGVRRTTTIGGFDYSDQDTDSESDDDGHGDDDGLSLVSRLRRQGGVVLGGGTGRRRRRARRD